MIESEDPLEAEKAIVILSRIIREKAATLGFNGIETLGPAPATVRRVKKKYRWNLGILSASARRLNTLTRAARLLFAERVPTSRVQLKVDPDPYGMF